ncbi:MAG: hypothetical protein ABH836_07350 [Candidatus Omnitrophota bacterium]
MKRFFWCFAMALLFLPVSFCRADTVFLKNGFSVDGTVKYQDSEKIILATGDGEVEFLLNEIKDVDMPDNTKKKKKERLIALYLKNGAVISAKLLKETDDEILVWWQGGEVGFSRAEIERMEYDKKVKEKKGLLFDVSAEGKWLYKNDVVVQLTNLEIFDVPFYKTGSDKIVLREELEGGGFIEQEIDKSKVEQLLFKPIENENSKKIEDGLRKLFPKMEHYQCGCFTIVTDSHPAWAKEYKKAVSQYMTDFYFTFFDLFKERHMKIQNFIVIFDEWEDFAEFASADGVPGWQVAGYFAPCSEALYMYNVLGENFSQKLYDAIIDEPGARIDKQKEQLKKTCRGERDIVIEGMADEIKFKYERYYKLLYAYYKDMTLNTLRHELTHELFYNYEFQNVVVSKIKNHAQEIELKKKYLEEKYCAEKSDCLKNLFALKQGQSMEMEAANSWLAEGIATYCETYPPGEQNKRWLFLFQEAVRQNRILPFEQLSVYKMGSFPGIAPEAMLYAYAQSWAFVSFLTHEYPSEFMEYQIKMAADSPEKMDDVNWFLEAIGKDLREIEKEFLAYTANLPELKDPEVNWVLLKNEIFRE